MVAAGRLEAPQNPMLFVLMAIGWVLVTGLFGTTLGIVKQELNA